MTDSTTPPPPPLPSVLSLNQRVRDSDGFLGTILYLGPVASSKSLTEQYAGIEWDDDTRGKHDGSVICKRTNALVRHFKCKSDSGNAGSFMKPAKIDTGVDLATTLQSRYVKQSAPLLAPDDKFAGCFAQTKKGGGKQIEFLGERKIRSYQQVEELEKVAVRGEGVCGVGDVTVSSPRDARLLR